MATHDRKICSASLVLVAPPISNTVAAGLTSEDQRVIEHLRRSHFYMICGRSKAIFKSISVSEEGSIKIDINLEAGLCSSGRIHIEKLKFFDTMPNDFPLTIKSNQDVLRLFIGEKIVFATTPDDLLMRRGRKQAIVSGFDNYREMMTFDLLYVGIAKRNGDSYSRLMEKGHKARMDILAAEAQRTPGARVSDETYLLLFGVEPLILTTFGASSDFDDEDINPTYDYHRIIADAEKAIISAFKPKYNKQLYKNYPRGVDGLYGQGYDAYSYSIAEGFAFNTAYGRIKGGRDLEELLLSNDADSILVDSNEVTLCISGEDFQIPVDHID